MTDGAKAETVSEQAAVGCRVKICVDPLSGRTRLSLGACDPGFIEDVRRSFSRGVILDYDDDGGANP